MNRIDAEEVPDHRGEIRLFSTMRDESHRIPYFLRYYRERGVNRFFIVDNGSSDGTKEMLADEPDVHVFEVNTSYADAQWGIEWIRQLLEAYGREHWCVVVDADEFLVYPEWESHSLNEVCAVLDEENASALPCILLDMYSALAFSETNYEAGRDPLSLCPFYETATITCVAPWQQMRAGQWRHYGGMRARLFGANPRLDKVSLFRYLPWMLLSPGMHTLSNALPSRARGAILHFKYFSDFVSRVPCEAVRKEHWARGREYRQYNEVLNAQPTISAWSTLSQQFTHSDGLIANGLMRPLS